ncbi:MAG: glycosyltransferase, partial [Pyrinomonadaceae bacterium]|nr:glycosyltransferase [Pyrinomonadaceae bacterium]
MKATIVIRTKNEGRSIEKTLDLIRSQVYDPTPEVLVVDSESTDATVSIVKKHRDVRLIETSAREFSYGRSLNVGFEA